MDRFVRAVRAVSQLCGFIAAGLIALGVLVVCHMVFVRYALGQNTIWQTDFTTYCLIAATFVGSPFVLLTRGHVNVDVLPRSEEHTSELRHGYISYAVFCLKKQIRH